MSKVSWLQVRALPVAIAAVSMGFVSGKLLLFNGSALNVLPWGILTLAVAGTASTRRHAIKLGGIFGFVVSFSFLWFNNSDPKTLSRSLMLTAFAGMAALFGLLCGMVLGWIGWKLWRLRSNKPSDG